MTPKSRYTRSRMLRWGARMGHGLVPVLIAAVLLMQGIKPLHAMDTAKSAGQPAPALAMDAGVATLAGRFHPGLDVTRYWVSEKYDGVRALWNGRQLFSRHGLPIDAPSWFTAHWPATPMDGELWAGRGQFNLAQSAVASGQRNEQAWQSVR